MDTLDYKVGDRIVIVKAEGRTIGRLNISLRDPHPELVDCEGTIIAVDKGDGMPHIHLDNGIELAGCECWWKIKQCSRRMVKEVRSD